MNPEIPSQRIPFAVITAAIAAILYSVQFFAPKNKVWMCSDGYVQRRIDIPMGLNYKAITLVGVLPSMNTAGYEYTLPGGQPLFEMNAFGRGSAHVIRDPHVLPHEGELWSDYAIRNGATRRYPPGERIRLVPCAPQ